MGFDTKHPLEIFKHIDFYSNFDTQLVLKNIFKKKGQQFLQLADEFCLLKNNTKPKCLNHYDGVPDSDVWLQIFNEIEWVGVHKGSDGAAGKIEIENNKWFIYLDSEGSFHVTGLTLIDHISYFINDENAHKSFLLFLKRYNLPVPITKEKREAFIKTLRKNTRHPDNLFNTYTMKTSKTKSPQNDSNNRVKTPRPLSSNVSYHNLEDGKILFATGEDFSTNHSKAVSNGVVYIFDPQSDSFALNKPLGDSINGVFQVNSSEFRFITPFGIWKNNKLKKEKPLWDKSRFLSIYKVGLKEAIIAEHISSKAKRYFFYQNDKIYQLKLTHDKDPKIVVDYVEKFDIDAVFDLGAELLIRDKNFLHFFDKKKMKLVSNIKLPNYPTEFLKVKDGFLCFSDEDKAQYYSENSKGPWRKIAPFKEKYSISYRSLQDGSVLSFDYTNKELCQWTIETKKFKKLGNLKTNSSITEMVELPDSRLLFIGGTLYDNINAEPEIFDILKKEVNCLYGYEKEYEKQHRVWLKNKD